MNISELYDIYTRHPHITTDTRDCQAGSIFIALKGERFDGNGFAAAALEKGCAYAVIDEPEYAVEGDCRYILTDNCLKTFQMLAREHRRKFEIPVIGITGTNGKTTTKELVSAVLSKKYNVLCTQGNFNNDVGVPKTLFRLDGTHEIAVVEMGASHPGDIKTLVEIAEPQYGIITNVGKAHLQGFGSFEGVVRTKGELYDFLRAHEGSAVFIDNGNRYLKDMAHGFDLISYGTDDDGTLRVCGRVAGCAPFLRFEWKDCKVDTWYQVQTNLIGSYNIYNMLAAACIGLTFGVSPSQINEALEGYVPGNSRSQLENTAHNHLIVDAYNANPTSMAAALENFRDMTVGPKMAILGDMRELGAASDVEHQRVVDFLESSGLTDTWLVGDEFGKTETSMRKFRNADEVGEEIRRNRPEGYYILIKGSNGVRLSGLAELL